MGSEDKVFYAGEVLLKLGQHLIQLFLQFILGYHKIRGSLISGLGIRLGCIPENDHRNIVLHVFSRKLGLKFDDFIIDGL